MHVAITGAAGQVGRVVADAFDTAALTLLTHNEHDDIDSELLDATDAEAVVAALSGVDVLVHLAWATGDRDAWDDRDEANLRVTTNVLEAAREQDLDRVVLASSAHVFGMYNRADPAAFESTVERPTTVVDTETPPRPDSFYGVAKVAMEALCSYYADRYDLDIVVVRIGWLMTPTELRGVQSDSADRARFANAMWLSHRDCRALFRRAVRCRTEVSPLVVHGISRNGGRFLELTETMRRLGYRPRDDASEVVEGD